MCGIAGIVHFDGRSIDPAMLDSLTDGLAHRGPESRGTVIDRTVGLGHRRLKILDLSDAAAQPMQSDDGMTSLVFNGEIYNFKEERERLLRSGARFRSSGDTEVLLRLYENEGIACVDRLRGMFAFAIHDKRTQQVHLVRDRVGKKPIKYFRVGSTFVFASELKALRTHPDCPHEIDQEALHHYLTMMYLPSPLTGFTGIKKLPAAHVLTIDLASGRETLRRYWQLDFTPDTRKTAAVWKNEFLTRFEESVRLRMIADVPVGAFLSGGIDSAAVVAMMARTTSHPVKTFSIGTAEKSHNELPYAAITAKHFGTDHHPIIVEPDIVHLLPTLVHTYEEPYADSSAIPTYLIAEQTRQHVTVALNGDGGDENFLGYARYPIHMFARRYSRLPSSFLNIMTLATRAAHAAIGSTFTYRCYRFARTARFPERERYLQYLSFFTAEEKRMIERSDMPFPATDAWYASRFAVSWDRGHDPAHAAASADLDSYLADDLLPKVDLGTMAHALEARSPFLDHTLLEFTAHMPVQYKLHGRRRKILLKQAMADVLPPEILQKPKTGFRLPLDAWFRGPLQPFVMDTILREHSTLWSLLDRHRTEEFLRRYFASRVDYSDHVWALLWLSEWSHQYTDR